jgi:hypothetical protein
MAKTRPRPLLPRLTFATHVAVRLGIALGFVLVSLAIGAYGYHRTESMDWLEAFLNAAMILGGMGPVDPIHTRAGKLFAICYAIFSGIFFLSIVAILFAPFLRRFLHRFHLEVYGGDEDEKKKNQEE